MIPILYEHNETQFTTNGLGALSDSATCTVNRVLNGGYELTLTYPVDGHLYNDIQLRRIVYASVYKSRQAFRIYRISKPMNGLITVYARHIVYDLGGIVVTPFSSSTLADVFSNLGTKSITTNPFTFSTTRSVSAAFNLDAPKSIWSILGGSEGSILDTYGGEYDFDNYTITLENRIGADRGVSILYGKNLVTMEQEQNCSNVYTHVLPYYLNDSYVQGTLAPVGTYPYTRVLSVDLTEEFESVPTVAQLNAKAQEYISSHDIGIPEVNLSVSFAMLEKCEEYKEQAFLEQIYLGDTVTVRFDKLGVNANAKVVEINWNVLLDRYDSVYIGSVRSSIADTIVAQSKEIETKPSESMVERISAELTRAITGADGGSVRMLDTNNDGVPDELYIADNPDPTQAQNVWRWNYQGWAFSNTGYNGTFTMGATIDGGIMANRITAGVMSADRILGGTLSLGGANNQNGKANVYNQSGTQTVWIDNNGITVVPPSLTDLIHARMRMFYGFDGSTTDIRPKSIHFGHAQNKDSAMDITSASYTSSYARINNDDGSELLSIERDDGVGENASGSFKLKGYDINSNGNFVGDVENNGSVTLRAKADGTGSALRFATISMWDSSVKRWYSQTFPVVGFGQAVSKWGTDYYNVGVRARTDYYSWRIVPNGDGSITITNLTGANQRVMLMLGW